MNLSTPNVTTAYTLPPGATGPYDGWEQVTTTPCSIVTVEIGFPPEFDRFSGRIGWLAMGWNDGTIQGGAWAMGSGQPVVADNTYVFEALGGAMMQDNRPYGPRYDRIPLAVCFWPLNKAMEYRITVREYW